MRIGELSRKTGISTSRIRFHEKHNVLPKPARNGNGYRTYPDTAAKILELIRCCATIGFHAERDSRRAQRGRAKLSVARGDG
jgi:DNA-binding transcriptional MerR regulator